MRVLTFGVFIVALLPARSVVAAAQPPSQPPSAVATITGRVVDAGTLVPVTGARVILLPARARPAGPLERPLAPLGPPLQTTTGEDGMYVFSEVAAGQYRLQIEKVGFVPTVAAGTDVDLSPIQTPLIEVGPGQARAVPDLRLLKGAVITGRVLDARGEPFSGLGVMAVRRRTGGNGRGRGVSVILGGQPDQTNDVGEFRITGLSAGDYYVVASPRPRSPFEESSTSVGTTVITTYYPGSPELAGAQAITVAAGQTIGGLEFTAMSAPAFAISGLVIDEMNRPVSGAIVMLMPGEVVSAGPRGSSRTQPDGTFRIGGVARGTYRLSATVAVTISSGGGGIESARVTGGFIGGVTSVGGGVVTGRSSPGSDALQVAVDDADVAGVTLIVRPR